MGDQEMQMLPNKSGGGHNDNADDVINDDNERILAPSERLLMDLRAAMAQKMSTDLFALLAGVLRQRAGKMQQASDVAWDHILRSKELQIMCFSFFGIAISVTVATVFWYAGNRKHTTLAEVSPDTLTLLYSLQLMLTVSTLVTMTLIVQKYYLLLIDKRRTWSGYDEYDLVQAKDNKEILDHFDSAYSFWRSNLRWRLLGELVVHFAHPLIWMNTNETKRMYEAFQIIIFLRVYLSVRVIYIFSEAYQQRHEIVASNVELQRTGFQLTIGSTLKMLFYDQPAKWTLFVMVGSLLTLGFIVFVTERSLETEDNQFRNVQACMWFAFVTFTTVGYGDMAPTTPFGRLASVAIGAIGIASTTIFGGVVTNLMVQSREQRYVGEYLTVRAARDELRDGAARVIQMAFRYYRQKEKDIIVLGATSGHKSNTVYAAIKEFRAQRWHVSQSKSAANDPVVDTKMNQVTAHLRQSLHQVKTHAKGAKATETNMKRDILDIVKFLQQSDGTA